MLLFHRAQEQFQRQLASCMLRGFFCSLCQCQFSMLPFQGDLFLIFKNLPSNLCCVQHAHETRSNCRCGRRTSGPVAAPLTCLLLFPSPWAFPLVTRLSHTVIYAECYTLLELYSPLFLFVCSSYWTSPVPLTT